MPDMRHKSNGILWRGELTGDKNTIEYFEAVSINRYTEQN